MNAFNLRLLKWLLNLRINKNYRLDLTTEQKRALCKSYNPDGSLTITDNYIVKIWPKNGEIDYSLKEETLSQLCSLLKKKYTWTEFVNATIIYCPEGIPFGIPFVNLNNNQQESLENAAHQFFLEFRTFKDFENNVLMDNLENNTTSQESDTSGILKANIKFEKAFKKQVGSSSACINLFDYPETYEVDEAPAEFWYLQILEIVIYVDGSHYLVLEYPFYLFNNVSEGEIKECMWTPPYVASKLQIGTKRIRKVNQIIKEYKQYEADRGDFLKELVEHKLYTMGIGDYDLIEKGDILEYKTSYREPSRWKCYYVKRFCLKNLGKHDLYSIVDPECVKGYSYLNIKKQPKLTTKSNITNAIYFKGKPLATNTAYLFQRGIADSLIHDNNFIAKDLLTYSENGSLFALDIISFGRGQKEINDTFKTLNQHGTQIADKFEFLLYSIFSEELIANEYNQYRLMGDGFIATSPFRHSIDNNLNEQLVEKVKVEKTLNAIDAIFKSLQKEAPNYPTLFSCRCALLFDAYFYGKIGGLLCDKPELGGASILKLARLQGIINSWFLENNSKQPGYIYLSIEERIYEKFCTIFIEFGYKREIQYNGSYKEYTGSVVILIKKIAYERFTDYPTNDT